MPVSPTRWFAPPAELEAAVRKVEAELRPDVVRIRYSLDEDWTGDPSIFFRVVLSDEAANPKRLGDVAWRVREKLDWDVNPDDFGLHAYTSFRSKSEQDESKDPDWA